jgi:hypothetical protein
MPMSEQLRRVYALLRAGNVPCTLGSTPATGSVLLAGTPNQGPWEVELRQTGGQLVLVNAREAVRIPAGATDAAIADAVKLRVVQAWAEQGDPQAIAVIRALTGASAGSGARPAPGHYPGYRDGGVRTVTVQFVDPMQVVGDMFAAATRMGWDMLKGRGPGYAALTMFNPWVSYQRTSLRR